MKEINLEKILLKYTFNSSIGTLKDDTLFAMKEACKQVLYLASENAKIKEIYSEAKKLEDYPFDVMVDKQSILNTINQVK